MICNISGQYVCVSVCVCSQAKSYGLDDGDVYMSSYENRFRLFSSVEYDGQLYMTPLNFIESVTLNEPKSECAPDTQKHETHTTGSLSAQRTETSTIPANFICRGGFCDII